MSRALRVLSDDNGTVVAGFLAPDVYYIRVVGTISSALGIRYASQFRQDLGNAATATCFFDASSAQGSDFAARSAIMRAFLANRSRLAGIKLLTAPGLGAARVRALAPILDNATEIVSSAALFNAQLLAAAPTAPSKLPASGRIPVARSVRPNVRSSMRPGRWSYRPRVRTGTNG
jgi:hypothetical protein